MNNGDSNGPDEAQTTTILRPTPGRRRGGEGHAAAPKRGRLPRPAAEELRQDAAANPLLRCASSLLMLGAEIRISADPHSKLYSAADHPHPDKLRQTLVERMRQFGRCAREANRPDGTILAARYALCTFLDEAIMSTSWGKGSDWATHGLLVTFYEEVFGGEETYKILERLLKNPADNLDLLELLYYCLAFGLQGRYAHKPEDRAELREIRENTYKTLRKLRPRPESTLSPHWRGLGAQKDQLVHYLPLWVLGSALLLFLFLLYWLLSVWLSTEFDPVHTKLVGLKGPSPSPDVVLEERVDRVYQPPPPPPEEQDRPTLYGSLKDDCDAGRLACTENNQGELVILTGQTLFRSGSAVLGEQYLDLIQGIGEALRELPGRIEVTGHADATKMKPSARYVDNKVLSKARAETVRDKLAKITEQPERFSVFAMGDEVPAYEPATDPRNRRVEVMLRCGH